MKPLRPAVAAVILTALLAVPAQADHKRFGGFFVEPFFVPIPDVPRRLRPRRQEGYPVALVRRRLRGIGFYEIGQFDVYPNAYGVVATDPGGVRVKLAIDRWTGDIVRARAVEVRRAVRPNRPPADIVRAPAAKRKTVALRVPPLPRPAPERLTQTANISPPALDSLEPETMPPTMPPPAVEDDDIVTSSTGRRDSIASKVRPVTVPEIDPIAKTAMMRPSPPVAEAPPPEPEAVVEAVPPEPELPVKVAAVPKAPAIAGTDQAAEAVSVLPVLPPKPVRPVTALQGERFDPADGRDPIADY